MFTGDCAIITAGFFLCKGIKDSTNSIYVTGNLKSGPFLCSLKKHVLKKMRISLFIIFFIPGTRKQPESNGYCICGSDVF
jgi:hypothetical protein